MYLRAGQIAWRARSNVSKLFKTGATTHMAQSSADGGQDQSPRAAMLNAAPGACIAIVTDGMWRKSLSAIRALGKAGFRVHVLGDSWLTVGFWSHFARQRVLAPDAKENATGFGKLLLAHLQSVAASVPAGARPVLLPMEEDSLRFVVNERETLRIYADFLVPDADALEVCLDKGATMALAARLGIAHRARRLRNRRQNFWSLPPISPAPNSWSSPCGDLARRVCVTTPASMPIPRRPTGRPMDRL